MHVDIDIEDHGGECMDELLRCFPVVREDREPTFACYQIERGERSGSVLVRSPFRTNLRSLDAHDVPRALLSEFTHLMLVGAPDTAHLHAAAVSDNRSQGIVLLGPSGAGKSVLTSHLIARGLRLVNDEQIAVHDQHGVIAGFTRPLVVKPEGHQFLPDGIEPRPPDSTWVIDPHEFGSEYCLSAAPALIVDLLRTDVEGVSVEHLSPAQALEVLCKNSLDIARKPTRAFHAYAWLSCAAPAVRLTYGSSDLAAVELLRLLAAAQPKGSQPRVVPTFESGDTPTVFGRRKLTSVMSVTLGGEVVIYDSHRNAAIRLNASGADLWQRLDTWVDHGDRDERLFVEKLTSLGVLNEV